MRKIVIVALALLSACSDGPGAKRVLEDQGYTDVKTDGHAWFSCASGENGDSFATKFKATSPTGKPVSGAVCSGWLKGSTIRFD